jgi:hypothetical protein
MSTKTKTGMIGVWGCDLVICSVALGPGGRCGQVWVAPHGARMKRIRWVNFETGTQRDRVKGVLWRLVVRVRVHLLARPARRGGAGGGGRARRSRTTTLARYGRRVSVGEKRGYAWRSVVSSQSRRPGASKRSERASRGQAGQPSCQFEAELGHSATVTNTRYTGTTCKA